MLGELRIKTEEERDDFLVNFDEEKNLLRTFFEDVGEIKCDALGVKPNITWLTLANNP